MHAEVIYKGVGAPFTQKQPLPNDHVHQEWPEALWGFESGKRPVRHWEFWPSLLFNPPDHAFQAHLRHVSFRSYAMRTRTFGVWSCQPRTVSEHSLANCGDNTSVPRTARTGGVASSLVSKNLPWGEGSWYIVINQTFSREFPSKCRQKRTSWTG